MSVKQSILVKIHDIESIMKVIEEDIKQTVAIHESLRDSYSKIKFFKRKLSIIVEELRIIKAELKNIKLQLEKERERE